MLARVPVLLLGLACCGRAQQADSKTQAKPHPEPIAAQEATQPPNAGTRAQAPAPDVALSSVASIAGHASTQAGAVQVVNRSPANVRLLPNLAIQRWQDGAWHGLPAQIPLAWDCETTPPACVELAPGAELQPPAWLASGGPAPCGCSTCASLPPGRYRLVAHSCTAAHAPVHGTPFDLE